MSARYAVRLAVTDGGEQMFWLVRADTGERLLSSVFRDTVVHLADAMNARLDAREASRDEAGCW